MAMDSWSLCLEAKILVLGSVRITKTVRYKKIDDRIVVRAASIMHKLKHTKQASATSKRLRRGFE
jgi:hypothetical protein